MKLLCFFIVLSLSTTINASECDTAKGKLELSFGIYQFKTVSLCKEVYEEAYSCAKENTAKAKKADTDKMKYVPVNCLQKLLGFFEKHKKDVTRIGDSQMIE